MQKREMCCPDWSLTDPWGGLKELQRLFLKGKAEMWNIVSKKQEEEGEPLIFFTKRNYSLVRETFKILKHGCVFLGGLKGGNRRKKGRSMEWCQSGKKSGGHGSEIVSLMGFLWRANRREAVLLSWLSPGRNSKMWAGDWAEHEISHFPAARSF